MENPKVFSTLKEIIRILSSVKSSANLSTAKINFKILRLLNSNTEQLTSIPSDGSQVAAMHFQPPDGTLSLTEAAFYARLSMAVYGQDVMRFFEFFEAPDVSSLLRIGTRVAQEAALAVFSSRADSRPRAPDTPRHRRAPSLSSAKISEDLARQAEDGARRAVQELCDLPPEALVRVAASRRNISPLWALLRLRPEHVPGGRDADTIALVVRGSWTLGDFIADANAATSPVFLPPVPALASLKASDPAQRAALPPLFRALSRDQLDDLRRRVRGYCGIGADARGRSANSLNPEVIMRVARALVGATELQPGDPTPYRRERAHRGLLSAASYVYYAALPAVRALMEAAPAAHLVVCGHSMGAAAAALLALFLRDEFPGVRAFAYATPACVTLRTCRELAPRVDSFVFQNDLVPRMSVRAAANTLLRFQAARDGTLVRDRPTITAFSPRDPEALFPPGRLFHIRICDVAANTRAQLDKQLGRRDSTHLHTADDFGEHLFIFRDDEFRGVDEILVFPTAPLNHRPVDYMEALDALRDRCGAVV